MTGPRPERNDPRARSAARRLLVQALYQRELGGQDWRELLAQFQSDPGYDRIDADYFRAALEGVCGSDSQIAGLLASHSDLPPERLDPVEHAILRLGLWELASRADVPYRVVINEAVLLARRFGATEGHRFVNAVLDRASRILRPAERGAVA